MWPAEDGPSLCLCWLSQLAKMMCPHMAPEDPSPLNLILLVQASDAVVLCPFCARGSLRPKNQICTL